MILLTFMFYSQWSKSWPALVAVIGGAVTVLCAASTPVAADVTFNREIAPILLQHCAACHRPGQSAPFSLLTFSDARKRARQIAQVTRSRFMPPWLPDPGEPELEGQRRLSQQQIDLFQQWIDQGLVEGDTKDLPVLPKWPHGWHLGEPDLILKMPEVYTLQADGSDVFRSFVIPVPITTPRFVNAVEMRPGNPRIVHHAIMYLDKSQSARRLDAEDDEFGYDGMRLADVQSPGGRFIGWTPGKIPLAAQDQMAWRLEPGTDIVLEMHMLPSGKSEQVQGSIGLFFTDQPPVRQPLSLLLFSTNIDIAPEVSDYLVEESYVLPVDVLLFGIYPHAHYLGKDMQAFAMLPDGSRLSFFRIRDWDFNWQDDYRYVEPVRLPKGATVTMRYTFDNSADNPRNPTIPPVRVAFGGGSKDEMASLTLEVMAEQSAEQANLQTDYEKYLRGRRIANGEKLLVTTPDDVDLRLSVALLCVRLNEHERAVTHFEHVVKLNPNHAMAHNQFGLSLLVLGRNQEAVQQFEAVLASDPRNVSAHRNLSRALYQVGQVQLAQQHRRKAAELTVARAERMLKNLDEFLAKRADEPVRLYNLANALHTVDRHAEAIKLYKKAIEVQQSSWRISQSVPHAMLHHNLAGALHAAGQVAEAIVHYKKSIELRPDDAQAHVNLANVLQRTGRADEAIGYYQQAVSMAPDLAPARFNLAGALASQQRYDESAVQLREILKMYPQLAAVHYYLGDTLKQMGQTDEATASYREALRLADETKEAELIRAIRAQLDSPPNAQEKH